MKAFFKELFQYNHHSNQKLWHVFNEHPDRISEKSIKLYNHILNAHHIWNSRINQIQNTYGVWDMHPIQNCMNMDKTNYENSLLILDTFDLNDMINYKNTKGLVFNNSIRDNLFHVINHSTYHRGQIATDFRQNGLDPLVTDYIFHKR
ncbi:DinB family protein [Confluentibacter flavum]|uniref:Damage-inducible protein DinB n=1 Tax=Confluentibacter flavum TaxID=1909700 RepID=A0A2N3HFL8_9FLAO|nr:DinB family protein [Confluentibacter flavum]PKQ43684.1 damage-inducible protein DinB [Confluentibacter flavum]